MERRAALSLNEWAVLGVLVDRARHGYDIAAELRPGAPIGDVWRVSRQLVYRALDRLEALELVSPRRTEPSTAGPPRTVYGPTAQGRTSLDGWLVTPVTHIRDVRNAFLLKVVITERLGRPIDGLVRAQREAFSALFEKRSVRPPRGDVVALWRHHSAAAVAAFLDTLSVPD